MGDGVGFLNDGANISIFQYISELLPVTRILYSFIPNISLA